MFGKSKPTLPIFHVEDSLATCSPALRQHLASTVWFDDRYVSVLCSGLPEEYLASLASLGAVKRRSRGSRFFDVTERYHWLALGAALDEARGICPTCGEANGKHPCP